MGSVRESSGVLRTEQESQSSYRGTQMPPLSPGEVGFSGQDCGVPVKH